MDSLARDSNNTLGTERSDYDSDNTKELLEDWNISGEKWIAMALLCVASSTFGILPYIIFSYYKKVLQSDSNLCKTVLAAMSSLSGGFLLATTMLHILPEVREKAEAHKSSPVNNLWGFLGANVPIAEILMLYGFCFIYGLEEVAHFLLKIRCGCCSHQKNNRKGHHHHHHHHSNGHLHKGFGGLMTKVDVDCATGLKIESVDGKYVTSTTQNSAECPHEELIAPPCKSQDEADHETCGTPMSLTLSNSFDSQSQTSNSCTPPNVYGSIRTLNSLGIALQTPSPMGALRSLVSLLALSFHAVMEGIAVGVQDSSDLWMTFSAIASHKCIIALCLGMEMMKSNMNWKTLVASILTFSLVSPIGILIGSVLASGEFSKSGIVIIIEGLATGTLLYIIFFEILAPDHHQDQGHDSEDFSRSKSKFSFQGMLKFIGTCLGVMLAVYLLNLSGHNHKHDHHSLEYSGNLEHDVDTEIAGHENGHEPHEHHSHVH